MSEFARLALLEVHDVESTFVVDADSLAVEGEPSFEDGLTVAICVSSCGATFTEHRQRLVTST